MKNRNTHKAFCSLGTAVTLLLLFTLGIGLSMAQVRVNFTQRTSQYTPDRKIYNIKGDFQMIGNTNMTLQSYSDDGNNSSQMRYVDIDGDPNTWNSSSATLQFSNENGALPECSNIIYAGLYWTGRAHDGTSSNTFIVSGETNIYNNSTTNGYQLNISQNGSNANRRVASYIFNPGSGGQNVTFKFSSSSVTVQIGSGSIDTLTSTISTSNNIATATLSSPYIVNTGTGTLTILSLRKRTDNNTINSDFSVRIATSDPKTLDKSVVHLKHATASGYTAISANDANFTQNIYYPTASDGYMYSAYAEVTDYVRQYGVGEYFVADMALREGDGGATGYYGGWGLIVVYENSKMNWRDVTIFDGHAYVAGGTTVSHELPVSGFNTVQSGNVNMKLGLMAGEGDRGITGDYFEIRNHSNTNWVTLSHSGNSANNFFNSSVVTGGNARNPLLQNNTGLDIAMFDIPNANNSVITNNQTSTRFRYGSTQDTYVIFCVAMAVDAYIPELEAYNYVTTINGSPAGTSPEVLPNDEIEYTVEVRNKGSEAINNSSIVIPLPYTTSYISSSSVFYYSPAGTSPTFNPSMGATGSIVWNLGNLPLPADPNTLLAKLTFKLKVTNDCFILSNANCSPKVTIDGASSGIGAVSGINFSGIEFIQGYETTGPCEGEPITTPVAIPINATDYVASNCQDQDYTTRAFYYCNVSGSTIPFSDVTGNFPPGTRFYSAIDETEVEPTPGAIEYTNSNSFPATSGTSTYYAIPPGITLCWWRFTITVDQVISTPTVVTPVEYCVGETAVPLTATPSNQQFMLFYYTSATGGSPQSSITPSTATAGTTSYWVAEGLSAQCISPEREEIVVIVTDCTCPDLISNKNVTNMLKK